LKGLIPDEIERCEVIMTECLYYGDLTTLNVFITTEILKCHIQSYTGLEELDYKFNSYTGDTLVLNTENYFKTNNFDAVIGNPPYNSSGAVGTGNTIWQDFTKMALNNWLIHNGYLLFVHPPGWRKPNTVKGKFFKVFDLMAKENQILYLEIHGIKDGKKTFNCGTRYDWYLIEKKQKYRTTKVVDESGVIKDIDLSLLNWLPNSNIDDVIKILAKNDDERCPILQSMSAYEPRKKWMSCTNDEDFKYPCIHSTPKSGPRFMYSKVNDKGHFGISKVIFGESGINVPIIDMSGTYGMTHGAMAIKVVDIDECMNVFKALQSSSFHKIIQSSIFSSYRIDWNIFREFKKDFWKEFV
jgi:hydrogenase maturation factor